jgi:hypothetical protein
MFGLIIIGGLFFLARHVWQNYPEIERLVNEAATMSSSGSLPSHVRCEAMSKELEIDWDRWDAENDPETEEFSPPKLNTHAKCQYFGPLSMEVEGDQILVFDMQVNIFGGKSERQLFQTVISIQPSELELPPFIIRPRVYFGYEIATANSIKTETALDILFSVETLTPHRVKALFQSPLGSEVLIPFLSDHRWTIEWNGDRILVHESNRLIEPQQLAEVALEVTEFFHLLKGGPAAIDSGMQELFKQSEINC